MKKKNDNVYQLITAYIDGELSPEQMKEVEQLLSETPEYHEHYLAEKRTKRLIKENAPVLQAPAQLRNRIRRQIARSGYRPSFWELVQGMFDYRPAATGFAFAVIAFFVLLPAYEMISRSAESLMQKSDSTAPGAKYDELTGEIICLDCDIFTTHRNTPQAASYAEHDPVIHHPGLRADDGAIWTILQNPSEEQGHYTRALLQKRAILSGTVFENSRYIHVDGYKVL